MQPPSGATNSRSGLVIVLVVGALLLCCGLPLGGIFYSMNWATAGGGKAMLDCNFTYGAVSDALGAYLRENDNTLPPKDGWQKALGKHYEAASKEVNVEGSPFSVPALDDKFGCAEGGPEGTGMAYNADVAGKKLDEIPADAVVFFEKPTRGISTTAYKAPPFLESPKMTILGMTRQRGWKIIDADAQVMLVQEDGSRLKEAAQPGGPIQVGTDSGGPVNVITEKSSGGEPAKK